MTADRTAEFPYWHPSKPDPYARHPAVQRASSLAFNRRQLRECLRQATEELRKGDQREHNYARDRARFRALRVVNLLEEVTA